jgi:hypothetical protein
MSDEEMRKALRGSPMKRAKAAGLRRNAAAVLRAAPASPPGDSSSSGGAGDE